MIRKALKAAGIDLEAAARKLQQEESAKKEKEYKTFCFVIYIQILYPFYKICCVFSQAEHAQNVPGMLSEIFKKIDLDNDNTLSADEFGSFVEFIGGAKYYIFQSLFYYHTISSIILY